jgi:hypothetical protein
LSRLGAAARRLDRFELGSLAALAALSVAVLAGLLIRVWTKGGIVTGSDGLLVIDQLQYLNWLRQAGDHLFVGNLYDIGAGTGQRSFLHPGIVISGLLHRAGLGLAAAYLVWKPVAVAALFAGALLYVRRFLERPGDRRLALVVALFGASPVAALVAWTNAGGSAREFDFDFLARELWPGNYLWGYLFTAIAVGLVPLGLLAYERGRLGWAAAAGLLAAWFQPWQGATLAILLVAGEAIGERRLRPRRLALPLVGTVAPLVYYLVLSKSDAAWRLADRANDLPRWPWWVTVAGLAPLAIPAALAYVRPGRLDFGRAALLAWPVAGIAIFYLPVGTFPFHALQGLALPLAVLAVIGVRSRLGDRPLPAVAAVAAAALLIVPGTIHLAKQMRDAVDRGNQAHYLTPGEHDALAYLDRDPEPGGVLAPDYIGTVVPAYTGRATWVGAGSWTRDFIARRGRVDRLFAGGFTRGAAESFVRATGARFLLSDCHGRADIGALVRSFTEPPRRFGCATVYRVST